MLLLPTLASLLYLLPFSTPQSLLSPTPPKLEYLYTAHVDCLQSLYETQGPAGIRKAIPIVGGNFTGPKGLNGKILNLGADWGSTDPQTGIFTADTRYNLQAEDGANLWLRTSGSGVPAGGLHLRVVIETGDKRWYWLNNVVGEFGVSLLTEVVLMVLQLLVF
ncbi:hypothetical protein PRZ48_003467 [Zasmidium cellare]|uniref:Uncharacterized protein n=1 Tax=Zasmidium cellare TaxID=395010 RepID=A0ABR0EV46_ZASCE|nr:hypothetical protein PRZ48_003467 [Zasmidium cellare]